MSERGRVMEAVEAMIAAGHSVEPLGDYFAFWIVDGKGLSDGDLLALASRLGLIDTTTDELA